MNIQKMQHDIAQVARSIGKQTNLVEEVALLQSVLDELGDEAGSPKVAIKNMGICSNCSKCVILDKEFVCSIIAGYGNDVVGLSDICDDWTWDHGREVYEE